MNNENKSLTKAEKIAITLNIIVASIVIISGIIRALVEFDVLKSFKNSLAYTIIDGIFLAIGVICLIFAFIYEKRVKSLKQLEENNKQNKSDKK